jgi:hypothetical protein
MAAVHPFARHRMREERHFEDAVGGPDSRIVGVTFPDTAPEPLGHPRTGTSGLGRSRHDVAIEIGEIALGCSVLRRAGALLRLFLDGWVEVVPCGAFGGEAVVGGLEADDGASGL